MANSHWDPIPNSENIMHMGPRSSAGYSAWNVDHHHVMSKAPREVHKGLAEAQTKSGTHTSWSWHPKTKHDHYPPMHHPLSPPRRQLHCFGFSTLGLLEPNPNPKRDPSRTPQPILHLNSNANPTPDPHPHIGPHTGVYGDIGTSVAWPCLCP